MKKNYLLTVLICALAIGQSFAQVTLNIADGNITITDTSYFVNDAETKYVGAYTLTGTSVANTIAITGGEHVGDNSVTIENLNIETPSSVQAAPFDLNTGLDFDLVLKGTNSLIAGWIPIAALQKSQTAGLLTISGDTLIAKTNYTNSRGAAIGGSFIGEANGENIEIISGWIYLESDDGAGIGGRNGGCGSGIAIRGGIITINVNEGDGIGSGVGYVESSDIIINGGSVDITSFEGDKISCLPVNDEGDTVYCVTLPHNNDTNLIVKKDDEKTDTLTFSGFHENDNYYYLYLPDGNYSFSTGDISYSAIVAGDDAIATLDTLAGDTNVLNVGDGDITIGEGFYQINNQPYRYSSQKYIITGTATDNYVLVKSGVDTIIMDNLDIQRSTGYTFRDVSDTNLVVILKGTNTLTCGLGYAAIQKDSIAGTLTICGTDADTLIATGSDGAAIGAGSNANCANINITGGVIHLKREGHGSPVIGVSTYGYSANNITISGGKITATTTTSGGILGNGENIIISGGVHNFYSIDGAYTVHILPLDIKVTGGTINSYARGSALSAFKGGVVTGGALNPFASNGTSISVKNQPISSDSTTLYHAKYLVPDITEPTLVDAITLNDTTVWGCKDMYTDSTGLVHLWVPVADTVNVEIVINGKEYIYSGKTVAYNNYVAPDEEEGIIEYGNYLWQVPLSIAEPDNGSIAVTSENNTLATGDYFCYKTNLPLSIATTPGIGYKTDSIIVCGANTNGDTTIVVTDTINISAGFSLESFNLISSVTGSGTLTISDGTNTYDSGAEILYGAELSISATPSDGSQLDSIVLNGVVTSSGSTITVSEDVNVGAYFSEVSGIEDQQISDYKVYGSEHALYVKTSEGARILVYSISGKLLTETISTGSLQQFDLSYSGVCVVKLIGNKQINVVKCVIR